ncbi:hypothetical protein Mboo_1010 [Methanoregula boonei 6A8]|uniref:Uncharacterized protein n=1 Tax=Methanoregula boonei (strain DSM 21154 / JCM 14090 / 6A8) TaxID=456442 RepID=A7I717_METB6|nr:hypothetical protein [Methanoregula boonei]ABS55528.1 hypothetical protein Mboo_1010 [Methanoregula boonei 6A8]
MQGDEDIRPGTMAAAGTPAGHRPARYLLFCLFVLCAVFGALFFVLPLPLYRLAGHCLEAGIALTCMCLCLYAYRYWSGRILLLLAAFAFGEYALATIFWYLFSILPLTGDGDLARPFVYTSVAELSFLGFMIFFIAAFQIEGKKEQENPWFPWLLLLLFLIVPFMVIDEYGITTRTVMLLVRFLIVEQLIAVTIAYGFFRYPLLWAGICIRCFAAMLYGLRETILVYYPSLSLLPGVTGSTGMVSLYDLLSIVGPLIAASFTLITLGLLDYVAVREQDRAGSPDPAA